MKPHEFESLLHETFEDQHLSRGEKEILKEIVSDQKPDDNRLALYRHKAFAAARQAISDGEARRILDWLENVNKILQQKRAEKPSTVQTKAFFSPGHDCPSVISRLIRSAGKQIDICVFTITDNSIASTILNVHEKGVPIRIITDNDKLSDLGSDIPRFANAGIPIRIDRTEYHMHHKFAVFDEMQLLTGSYNWTRGAAKNNLDHFIVSNDPELVMDFSREFEKVWATMKPFHK